MRLLHISLPRLSLPVHPDCRVSELSGRYNIVLETKASMPDLRLRQAQPLACQVKTFVTWFVRSCLLGRNDLIKLHTYRLFCLLDNVIIRIGNQHDLHVSLQGNNRIPRIWKWLPPSHRIGEFLDIRFRVGHVEVIEGQFHSLAQHLAVREIRPLDRLKLYLFPIALQCSCIDIRDVVLRQFLSEISLDLCLPINQRSITIKSNSFRQRVHQHTSLLISYSLNP